MSKSIYKGRQVAVKVLRVYVTNNFDVILSVSVSPIHGPLGLRHETCRGFAGRLSCGSTSNTRMFSRCSA